MAAWCALIFALSARPDYRTDAAPLPETLSRKAAHLIEYGVLAWLALRALAASGLRRRKAMGTALLFCVVFAASDEWHQTFVPGRYGKVRDVALDVLGAAMVLSVLSRRSSLFPKEAP